jgi:tetratricopeptide (TPR) repeat protein
VLTTSREPLGVVGEVLHPVDALADHDAVRLFAERGAAVRPGFRLTDDVRPVVQEICRRLDGQPLAIELAAARLRTLAPAEIRTRLDDRFRLLTTGARTAEPRHRTLRAVVDWSWDLLDESERALARRLAVFADGATEEAARAVCGLGDDTLPALTGLVDKSLLLARSGTPTRYRMLETIREYAGQRLDEAGERSAVEAAHAALVLELVETAEPRLRRPGQLEWVARLRAEADDVAAVLRRAVAADDAATAQRLVAATAWFWMIRGMFGEATERLAVACALEGPVPTATRALCAAYRAMVAAGAGDFAAAGAHLATAERLAAALPPDQHPVLALMGPVAAGFGGGDPAPLERLAADPDADPWARAFATFSRGQLAENEGDRERQRTEIRAAHAMFSALGDRWGLGMTVSSLGDLESVAGAFDAAERAFDEAIALAEELGNDDDLPQFRTERARVRVRRGDVAAGRAELRRLLGHAGLHPELVGIIHLYLADAARRAEDLDDARRELTLADPDAVPGPGGLQRRALQALTGSALAHAAGDREEAAALLARAVAHAAESKDGPVTAAVAERAAAHALADGDPHTAAALLGVAAGQRGALDVGDPDVRVTLDAVGAALGAAVLDAVVAEACARPRADGVARLGDYVRARAGGTVAGSDSVPASASASATSRE